MVMRKMYLFTFHSKVNPKSKTAGKFRDVGGAYVSCWVSFKDFQASVKLAKLLIRDAGWIPEKKVEESKVQRKWCKKKSDEQYYAEALKYGYTLVFNMYPKDAEDANVDYESKRKK